LSFREKKRKNPYATKSTFPSSLNLMNPYPTKTTFSTSLQIAVATMQQALINLNHCPTLLQLALEKSPLRKPHFQLAAPGHHSTGLNTFS
jgi:hypothetical protein